MITVDANIYISAFEFGGNPERLLHRAIAGDLQVAISQPILDEVLRILRDKFGRSAVELTKTETLIRSFAQMVTPSKSLEVIAEDPDDNRVLECAVASGSDVIVSGDKDLLRRGSYEGIAIMKVSAFLER